MCMLYSHSIPSFPIIFFSCYFSETQILDLPGYFKTLLVLLYIRNTTAVDILFIQAIVQLYQQIMHRLL